VTLEAVRRASSDVSAAVLSDSSGQFTFSSLPAGAYLVSAQKRGYAPLRLGQKQWNGPGNPVVLDQDSQFVAELRLHRLASISGEVLDENGIGLPNVVVHAYRASNRLRLAQSGVTDDRGMYRIPFLEPGRYYVRTSPTQLEDRRGLLPTFFGQTARAQEARVVEVRLEDEIAGVNLEPLPGRLARLTGTVLGSVPANVTLLGDGIKREARVGPGGIFSFDELAPGPYELLAESAEQPPLVGYQRTNLAGEQQTIELSLGPAPAVRVRCSEKAGKSLDKNQISIFVRRKDGAPNASPQRIVCDTPTPLAPGRWEFAATGPAGAYVASITNAERGSEGYEFSMTAGQDHAIGVVFGSNPAAVRGKVTTSDGQPAIGAPVFLYPLEDETRNRTGGLRTARADQNGEFRFPGIPPGRYEVLSSFQVTDDPGTPWPAGRGSSITLEEGADKEMDLPLIDLDR
jgi:protocatechuate 3,4-dioxygenase beta subunit